MKPCTKCETPTELSEFPLNKSKVDGLDNWCKPCHKLWREENKDIQKVKKDIWYQQNKQRLKEKRDDKRR